MHTSLRIKKFYFDKIKSGEKVFEYRKNSLFYKRLFSKPITEITFHYQQKARLTVEIKNIRLVAKPKRFRLDEMLPTSKIYVLSIGRVLKSVN